MAASKKSSFAPFEPRKAVEEATDRQDSGLMKVQIVDLLRQPWLASSLRLNTVVVFVAVAFFAWIWSVSGMIIAVPLLIVIKVVCDSIPKFQKLGLFLGDAQDFKSEVSDRPAADT